MSEEKTKRPFVEPTVSEPTDALAATRAFGGALLGGLIGGGASGVPPMDGDICQGGYENGTDPTGLDGADGYCL